MTRICPHTRKSAGPVGGLVGHLSTMQRNPTIPDASQGHFPSSDIDEPCHERGGGGMSGGPDQGLVRLGWLDG